MWTTNYDYRHRTFHGKGQVCPIKYQYKNVEMPLTSAITVNQFAAVPVDSCVLDFDLCALSTDLIACDKNESFTAWERANLKRATTIYCPCNYQVFGPLFLFLHCLCQRFDVSNDPKDVIIDFKESRINNMSAIDTVNKITERYAKINKNVNLRHLNPDCKKLLQHAEKVIDVNIMEDPMYMVAND